MMMTRTLCRHLVWRIISSRLPGTPVTSSRCPLHLVPAGRSLGMKWGLTSARDPSLVLGPLQALYSRLRSPPRVVLSGPPLSGPPLSSLRLSCRASHPLQLPSKLGSHRNSSTPRPMADRPLADRFPSITK